VKFRMIWLGPIEEPSGAAPVQEERPVSENLPHSRYGRQGAGLVRCEQGKNQHRRVTTLTNFTAQIVTDIVFDNGIESRREFGMEAEVAGQRVRFVVPAAEFSRMNWVLGYLGPRAIIYPGQHQHARAAIQSLSGRIRQERIFTHVGWKKEVHAWVYLQAGGAITPSGIQTECQVRLPGPLRHYEVPVPANPAESMSAVHASLGLLAVAPERVSLPLLAAVYRAPFGGADFSMFLAGRSGIFKTALAALCQQHFGARMDANGLPASFSSTGNALEELVFAAKDALLVVDDFVPTGGIDDRALHGVAERLFRAAGNHQGRGRMNGQGTLLASRPPRALLLGTGEQVPRGDSLRGRLIIVEVHPGDVDRDLLCEGQRSGWEGKFTAAMGAYLMWMAPRYDQLQNRLRERTDELRRVRYAASSRVHARVPTALAGLQSAFEIWLEFAVEVGAITNKKKEQLEERCEKALDELARLQVGYHRASEPELRFVYLLKQALWHGEAHLADRRGDAPARAEKWGWQKAPNRPWAPRGARIGWVSGRDLFLEPDASYEVAQQMAGTERLLITAQTLRHRLGQLGLLASVDAGRQMLLVRRTFEGAARKVLHFRTDDFLR